MKMLHLKRSVNDILNMPLRSIPPLLLLSLASLISALGLLTGEFGSDWLRVRRELLIPPIAMHSSLYPPHIVIFTPHVLLPETLSVFVQSTLLVGTLIALVRRFDGTVAALLLTLINPAALLAVRLGQLDWVPALALLLPAPLAGIALTAKPQVMFGVALLWLRRREWTNFVAAIVVLGLGALYSRWWQLSGLPPWAWSWNASIFPFGVPAALYFAWRAWRAQRTAATWAVLIAPFASPYFALYSLAPVLAVICAQNRRAGAWLVAALWYLSFFTLLRDIGSGRI
jgi:hypothetical protein